MAAAPLDPAFRNPDSVNCPTLRAPLNRPFSRLASVSKALDSGQQFAHTLLFRQGFREDTKTTVMLPGINGGLAPAMKVEERRTLGANNTVESQKSTFLLDGAGNWQVNEVRQATTRQEGKNRSTEERVSRTDSEGKLGEVSRTVSKASEGASGEKRNTVETYSLDVPGSARDGSLHLVQRASTSQRTNSTGQQTTEQQVEQPSPGDPASVLQVITLTTDTVRPGPSGEQATRTVQVRGVNGSFGIVSVDTKKSDDFHAIQVQIAPSEKPK